MAAKSEIGSVGSASIDAMNCRGIHSGWRSQFGNPRGFVGRWVGRLMGLKNAPMNRLAVELLEIGETDSVLEIGFGEGRALGWAAERASRGWVAGIDRSATMVDLAARLNRRWIGIGQVEVRTGDSNAIPYPDSRFDRAFAVNSYHIWPEPNRSLAEIRRVLRPGGTLLLALRMKHPTASRFVAPGMTEEEVSKTVEAVRQAGFSNVRVERRTAGRDVSYLIAH